MSGRRPLCFEGRFLWHPTPTDDAMESQHDYLPRDVFALLDGHIPRDNPRVDLLVKAYHTREAAIEALCRAIGLTAVQSNQHNPLRSHGADGWTTAGNSEGI